jgi:Mrp family chromosome partitioning ATPase
MRVAVCTPQRQLRDDWSAANIARCLSLQGDRVAVIDANLHVSALAQQLQIDGGPGLSELLTGACAFADVLHRDAKTRVHAIGAGKTRHDPAGIIVSERLEKVLDALEGSYSYIVINAPPILLAPETRVIAGHVDAAALIPDGLPGSARMVEKAREVLLAAGLEAEEIMVAGPETTQPPRPIAARGDAEEAAEHDAA